jgi:hypothetical protein
MSLVGTQALTGKPMAVKGSQSFLVYNECWQMSLVGTQTLTGI